MFPALACFNVGVLIVQMAVTVLRVADDDDDEEEEGSLVMKEPSTNSRPLP